MTEAYLIVSVFLALVATIYYAPGLWKDTVRIPLSACIIWAAVLTNMVVAIAVGL